MRDHIRALIKLAAELSRKQTGRTLEYVQYAFIRDGNAYIVTYTTVPETGKQYDELFRESAESFRIL